MIALRTSRLPLVTALDLVKIAALDIPSIVHKACVGEWMGVSGCVGVCVCVRVCVCVCVHVSLCMCVCVCMRARSHMRECVCECAYMRACM